MREYALFCMPKKQGLFLDPRTKIFLMAVLTTLLIYQHEGIIFISAVSIIPCVLLFANRQRRIAFVYSILVILAFTLRLTREAVVLSKTLNTVSLLFGTLVLRLMPIFMLGEYLIKSTSSGEFVAAMQRMHVPDKFIIPVSVVFRFVPTIAEESRSITYAMKMREISFGTKRFRKNPGAFLEYRLIPLMISVAKIGDELSAAALTKGLGSKTKRQSICSIGFGICDILMIIIIFGLIAWTVLI